MISVEQMRHRLLALSALCPGASALLGNLLHTASASRGLQVRACVLACVCSDAVAWTSWQISKQVLVAGEASGMSGD